MINFTGYKQDVALFVEDILTISSLDFQSITIIPLEKSGVCSVNIATDTSSEDTVEKLVQIYLEAPTSISLENIQDGSSLSKSNENANERKG
jgi:collagenase-like PrtC family protease